MNCIITGAADGIGRALAHRFAEAGYDIVGVDVDLERAERTLAELEAKGVTCRFIMADLGTQRGVNEVLAGLGNEAGIDVLIHNAGINAVGVFEQVELARQEAVIKINLLAPMLITTGLLQAKRLKEGSTLVFISSLSHCATQAWRVSSPGAASYAASKDGLASYARSLSGALSGSEINVLTVYPGPTKTAHARRYSPDNRREHRRMPPELLANQIFHAVQTRQRFLIPGLGNRLFAWLGWAFPRMTERVMRKVIFTQRARSEKLAGGTDV